MSYTATTVEECSRSHMQQVGSEYQVSLTIKPPGDEFGKGCVFIP